jgi:hypothetical protein
MSTFRPYGACFLFDAANYKHFAPDGAIICLLPANCLLPTAYCLLSLRLRLLEAINAGARGFVFVA